MLSHTTSSPFVFTPCRTDVVLHLSLATFATNIPVIFVTFRSRRFENDSMAKVVASLAVSDVVQGIIVACCAGVAWSLQPGEQAPQWLLRVINSGMYTFGVRFIWEPTSWTLTFHFSWTAITAIVLPAIQ